MEIVHELVDYFKTRKKFWLAPILIFLVAFGGLNSPDLRHGSSSICLHAVLSKGRRHEHPWHFGVLPRQCRSAGQEWANRRRRAGGALHTGQARCTISA